MKKVISVVLSVIMMLSALSVLAFAADTYTVTFTDMDYATKYRDDQIGRRGFTLGKDYYFTYKDSSGKTVEVKKDGTQVKVPAGRAFSCFVVLADYIEPTTLRVIAYPASSPVASLYDPIDGAPYGKYSVDKSSDSSYGIIVKQDMTLSVSEYHLYNDGFLYSLKGNKYFDVTRLNDNGKGTIGDKNYEPVLNERLIYWHQDLYFMVTLPAPETDTKHSYNYDTYTVTYTQKLKGEVVKKEVLTPVWTSADGLQKIYCAKDCYNDISISINGVVDFTFDMIKEVFEDLKKGNIDMENIGSLNFGAFDLTALISWINGLIKLIKNILAGFGVGK